MFAVKGGCDIEVCARPNVVTKKVRNFSPNLVKRNAVKYFSPNLVTISSLYLVNPIS